MPYTFADAWRTVRLHVPQAPALLAQTWVRDAFRQFWDRRQWAQGIYQGQIIWQAQVADISCTVTTGSAVVTAAAGTFTAGMVGRQFRVGTWPIYTILSVLPDGSQLTLSETYQGTPTGAITTGQVLDAYATMPVDFGAFVVITDPTNQRLIPWWATQQELALIDPTRTTADSVPRLLVASAPSVAPDTVGQVQYEFWPKPTAAGVFPYYASKRPPTLNDQTVITGVLAHRQDVLETGALAAAARWPGTSDQPNPYFNLTLANTLQKDFLDCCNQLDLRDDDVYQQSWDTIPWQRWSGFTWAYGTHLLQMTDATIGDYAGYLGGAYSGW